MSLRKITIRTRTNFDMFDPYDPEKHEFPRGELVFQVIHDGQTFYTPAKLTERMGGEAVYSAKVWFEGAEFPSLKHTVLGMIRDGEFVPVKDSADLLTEQQKDTYRKRMQSAA